MLNFLFKNKTTRVCSKSHMNEKLVLNKKKIKTNSARNSGLSKFLMRVLVIIFIGVTGYVLFFSPFVMVNSIVIGGAENIDSQKILAIATKSIAGKYLGVFAKDNIVLINKSHIITVLKNNFKRIADVKITKEFPNKLLIEISERKTALIFCSGEQCFVIDEQGRSYAPAKFEENELGEREAIILRDTSQKAISANSILVDDKLLKFIAACQQTLKSELNIDARQEFSTPNLASGDIRVETTDGWKIYFNSDIAIDKEIELLRTVLNSSLDKDKLASLDYIDLRVDNKVYYRLKNQEII